MPAPWICCILCLIRTPQECPLTRTRVTTEAIEKTFISAESLLRDSIELGLQVVRSGFRPSFLVGVGLWDPE